jgi:hypothetical protein
MSLQKIANSIFMHINGRLIGFAAVNETLDSLSNQSRLLISTYNEVAILGQGRFTSSRALYGTGNFTPPTEAFLGESVPGFNLTVTASLATGAYDPAPGFNLTVTASLAAGAYDLTP